LKQQVIEIMSRYIYENCSEIFDGFAKFPYALIKGEPLSIQAYGKPGMRHIGDVDILISKMSLNISSEILTKFGFTIKKLSRQGYILTRTFSHQTGTWHKKISNTQHISIDINYDIFWGEFEGPRIDIDEFLSDAVDIEIYGHQVKTLPPIKALIQLALHHYKDMNSIYLLSTRNSIKKRMFNDFYFLFARNINSIPLNKLYELSSTYGILPYIFYIFFYTELLYDDTELSRYTKALKTLDGENLLHYYGLNNTERRKWKIDFNTRLDCANLHDFIKDDLTKADLEKIIINKGVF